MLLCFIFYTEHNCQDTDPENKPHTLNVLSILRGHKPTASTFYYQLYNDLTECQTLLPMLSTQCCFNADAPSTAETEPWTLCAGPHSNHPANMSSSLPIFKGTALGSVQQRGGRPKGYTALLGGGCRFNLHRLKKAWFLQSLK